jgi:hypothetical protein
MRVTYKITLHGIKDGENQSEVVERLMSLAKLPRYRVILLLTKLGTTVKRGLDARQAAMYEAVLDRAGCNVYRAPEPSSFSPPKEPSTAKTARSPAPHKPTTRGRTEPAAGLAKKKLPRKAQMVTVGGVPFVVTT